VLIGVLGIITGAHLAAVFLAGDSRRAGQPDLVRAFRTRALATGVLAGAVAIGGLLVLRSDARDLFDGLTSGGGLACVIGSAIGGVLTLVLVWKERYGPARLTAGAAVGTITVGWALAQSPYLLPPDLTLEEAAASDATLAAVLVGMAIGALVLVPSLVYLYRLVLRGTLDQEFEPLDQRFRPRRASDADSRDPA
jgi:cytochrome bd ubiquinol oxidase subunit II